MKIGILYEGDYDQPFSLLIKRIVTSIDRLKEPSFDPLAANGSIYSKVETALKLFFEVDDPCDFAIFINDMDTKRERCSSIKTKVRNYLQRNALAEVYTLCPDPCFEQWFFEEENALRHVLGLSSEEQTPFASLHPKTRLEKLIFTYNDDFTKSKMDIYKEIVERINIQAFAIRNKEFKKFYLEILKKRGA